MLRANKKQCLSDHLLNVAELSKKLILNMGIVDDKDYSLDKLSNMAYFSGKFHDTGKVEHGFQDNIDDKSTVFDSNGVHIEKKGFSFNDHARHNEISWLIMEELFKDKFGGLNRAQVQIIKNVVLWHHAAPNREEKFTKRKIIDTLLKNKNEFILNFKELIDELSLSDMVTDDMDDLFDAQDSDLIRFKHKYSESPDNKDLTSFVNDIRVESITSLIRTVVITADRYVSSAGENVDIDSLCAKILEKDQSGLSEEISKMESSFYPGTDISNSQSEAAIALSKFNQVSVLDAPAGAGKTKTSLQWAKETGANKIYYIAPRTIVCEELYSELKGSYLPKNVSIEIITGEKKFKWDGNKEYEIDEGALFNSDIVITTIDQISKVISGHKQSTVLMDVLKSHVVFDEFHEYYKLSGFDVLFAELVRIKNNMVNSNTLLMSATVNYFYLEKLLNVYEPRSKVNPLVRFETFNKQKFNLSFETYDERGSKELRKSFANSANGLIMDNNVDLSNNPFYKQFDDNKKTIVISNTATTAQLSYLHNEQTENSLLAHSKLKKIDKDYIFSYIKSSFGKSEELLLNSDLNILRAGPIVQASLNITSERLITDVSSPENILQRLGRLNRFGIYIVGQFIIALPDHFLNNDLSSRYSDVCSLLGESNELESTLLWIEHLQSSMSKDFQLSDIYECYRDFYKRHDVRQVLEGELVLSLRKSCENIARNILDPIEIKLNKKDKKTAVLSKVSLRGEGFYVKMAHYSKNNGIFELKNDYIDGISVDRNSILLFDEDYKFVRETLKRFEQINPEASKVLNNKVRRLAKKNSENNCKTYMSMAKNIETPVCVSLSKTTLNKCAGITNDMDSTVYLSTDKQAVGYLKLKNIIREI